MVEVKLRKFIKFPVPFPCVSFTRCLWVICFLLSVSLVAQSNANQETPQTETPTENPTSADDVTVTGGVEYNPDKNEEEALRDPFKSPFELEEERKKEQEEAAVNNVPVDRGETEPYEVDVLDLKGIYLDARSGYWAIFKVGDEYTWYQKDTKFTNGDLVNITDGAVIFKLYSSDDTTQVRDLVKELDPGEE